MSDFVPCDILPDLWAEILRRHWTFLETEESIQKLEERKKLEGCLKEFLCVVPHDRKFFLPETGHVLRKSVRELTDFTAQNAIVGFEAISQYANNLFTKPWRKEFRVLKTYSGSFQHDIKSHLLDTDQLFVAMGYRRVSEDTFVLDGPICPDQVTNVSRDAMAAYVECQIMKHIYAGLTAAGFTCSWLDIFQYRERHVGGTTQTIKEMAYRLHEKRLRKEKLLNTENTYSNVAPVASKRCEGCAPFHHQQQQQQQQQQPLMTKSASSSTAAAGCAHHGNGLSNSNAAPCALHPNGPPANLMYNDVGKFMPPYPTLPPQQQQQQQVNVPGSLMTHSRSLEHYNEPHAPLPHRHSFDHQQQGCTANHHQPVHPHLYETPYDCLDGLSMGSSVSYAAVAGAGGVPPPNAGYNAYAHPYNAPGNRYPLPYNISSQLNSHYATPADRYAPAEQNVYATIGKTPSGGHSCNYHTPASLQYRQSASAYPNDHHLIDFDDRAQLTKHDFGARDYDREGRPMYDQRPIVPIRGNSSSQMTALYAQPRDSVYGYDVPAANLPTTLPQPPPTMGAQDMYIYARPVPKSSRMRALAEAGGIASGNMTDKYARNAEHPQDSVDNNRKMHKELKERGSNLMGTPADGLGGRRKLSTVTNERDTSDLTSYESASLDDFVAVGPGANSPPLMPKVREGVGSFESWNYVFKNLERSGYSKDLGDREDLLVQSLDLDSLNLSNGQNPPDKRRSTHLETKSTRNPPQQNGEKARTLEKAPSKRESTKTAATEKVPAQSISAPIQTNSSSGNRKVKSALKSATIDSRSGPNGASTSGSAARRSNSTSTGAIAKQPPPVSTQLIVTSPNEWSCNFCTFLNPDTKRICEMCCRSKDFNPEAAANVSHASSTCV